MKNKNKKLISAILIILIIAPAVLFGRPKQAQAQWYVIDGTNLIANIFTGSTSAITTGHVITTALIAIAKQAVMIIERRLLQEMTKSITGWINSGFHGAPLFLTNSNSFFHDIAKTEIKTLINEFGYDPARFPFGEAFALNTINAYKRTADANAAYSLSAVMTDPIMLRNYQNNFNTGGWNGFLINTQYPQNNYLGFQMMATEKLARQLQGTTQNAAQKITTTLNQGMGFLSPQTCPSNPSYNNGTNEFQKPSFQYTADFREPDPVMADVTETVVSGYDAEGNETTQQITTKRETPESIQARADASATWSADKLAKQQTWATTNTCPGGLVNTTPGSVAANQIFTALGVDIRKTELGSMVEGSLSAILNTLVSHFLDKGLNALSSEINGSSGTTDSWSYKGNSLITNSVIATGGTLSISPTSVSVFPGNAKNNIIISGGTPPYYLLGTCDNGGRGTTSNVTRASCMTTTDGAGAWNAADPQFASVFANSDGSLTVIGIASGTSGTASNTSVTIQDSSSPAKIITLPITITANATTAPITTTPTDDSIGTCTIGGHPTDGVKRSDCGNLGTWRPTPPPEEDPWGICTLGNGDPAPAKEADCKAWDGDWKLAPPPVITPTDDQTP